MQHNHIFEYAVIRIVPRVQREEFVNVGVILYCRQLRFLQTIYCIDEMRLRVLWEEVDLDMVMHYLDAFKRITDGTTESGPIGKLDIASRFRWLTATRSTVVQTSKIHAGFCTTPQETLNQLFEQLVM
jgi:hypothetical protein